MCFSEVFDTKQLEDDGLCWTYGKKKKKIGMRARTNLFNFS